MKPRNALVSKVAAAALAFGLAQGAVAWAQDNTAPQPVEPSANATTTQAAKGQLVSSWTISADPMIPIGLIAGLGLLYGAGCLIAARGKTKGAWLRAAAGGVMVVTLVNPEILTEEREVIPTEVVVVVDKSGSQKLDGRDVTTQGAYDDVIRQLARIPGTNVRTIELNEDADMNAAGFSASSAARPGQYQGTGLFRTIDEGLADVPRDRLGAVIVLTDGVVHDAPPNTNNVDGSVPMHVLLSGRAGEVDRRIVIAPGSNFKEIDEGHTISFTVFDDGVALSSAAKPVRVTITNEGKDPETLMVTPGEVNHITVSSRHLGRNIIQLEVEPLEGEVTTLNNQGIDVSHGWEGNKNVLLISGAPDGSMRMFRDVIKTNSSNNLVHLSILRPPEKQDNTPLKELSMITLPTNEIFADKLNEFDLIIFDHYAYDGLIAAPYLDKIAKYVREGGSLLVVAGPEFSTSRSLAQTPLGPVLPAQPNGQSIEKSFVPKANTIGSRHPVVRMMPPDSKDVPWGPWLRMVGINGAKGHTLLDGADGRPLLILNRENEGRVGMLLSDQSWLWAKNYQGGGPSYEMLSNVSQWLMKYKKFEEESVSITEIRGQIVVDQQTMSDSHQPITLYTPSGKAVPLKPEPYGPGIWRSTLPAEEIGIYRVEQKGPYPATEYEGVRHGNELEYEDVISTPSIMEPVITPTGGAVIRMLDAKDNLAMPNIRPVTAENASQGVTGDGWIGVKMNGQSVLKGVTGESLLPPWLSLILIIGAIAQAYAREGDRSLFKKETWRRMPKNNDGPQI
jgi:hypothetical protein